VSGQQHALAALYAREKPVTILQEAGWAPGPVWTGGKSHPHRDSIPDLPDRSSVAIPTELPGPQYYNKLRVHNVYHNTIVLQLPTVFSTVTCCIGL